MSLVFAVAAQSLSLPDGTVLDLRVNQVDTSQVEIHVRGRDDEGQYGTHILTFKRNGGPLTQEFRPAPDPAGISRPASPTNYASVDKDAVRTSPDPFPAIVDPAPVPPTPPAPTKSAVNTTQSLKAQSDKDDRMGVNTDL